MKTIDEIRDAFHLIHRVATGQSDRAYMSIPANPECDADLIVGAAIDELGALRADLAKAQARVAELEAKSAAMRAALTALYDSHQGLDDMHSNDLLRESNSTASEAAWAALDGGLGAQALAAVRLAQRALRDPPVWSEHAEALKALDEAFGGGE